VSSNFGINLSFAVKRWVEPEAWAKIVAEDMDLELVQFSFDLLDPWWADDLGKPLARRVQQAASDHNLNIHSAFVGLAAYTYNALLHPVDEARTAAVSWFKRAIERAADMGAPAVGGPVGAVSPGTGDMEPHYARLHEILGSLCDYAKTCGLESYYIEPTPLSREIPWSVAQAQKLVDDMAGSAVPIKYAVDLGHALYEPLYGEAAAFEPWLELGDHIGLIHLQQTDGQSDSHWGFTREGIVDPAQVAAAMARAGVNVPLILEVFYPFELADEAVYDDIIQSVSYCKQVLG
jgi:sugar phosphate isomerase/epimerase